MVLVLKALPTKATLQLIFSVLFDEGHQVQRLVDLHAQDTLVITLVDQDVDQRKSLQRPLAEASVYVAKQQLVDAKVAAPLLGFTAAFRRQIRARDHMLDAMLARKLVE